MRGFWGQRCPSSPFLYQGRGRRRSSKPGEKRRGIRVMLPDQIMGTAGARGCREGNQSVPCLPYSVERKPIVLLPPKKEKKTPRKIPPSYLTKSYY